MPGIPIEVDRLTKRFGDVVAVDDLSFRVEPGSVTGFVGPNGAGKTTTLRCILGLVKPTSGRATIGGQPYAVIDRPLHVVGAALEPNGFHPARNARDHLRMLCASGGLPNARADEMLAFVGLADAAHRRVGGFSTGMRQRLGLAAALLAGPQVLVLDEPSSGLDPAGITWLRTLLRTFADQHGATVLVSSHLLSELEHAADRIVIVSQGRFVREGRLSDLLAHAGTATTTVRSPELARLADACRAAGLTTTVDGEVAHVVAAPEAVGHVAFVERIELHELTAVGANLEQVFLELTRSESDAPTEAQP